MLTRRDILKKGSIIVLGTLLFPEILYAQQNGYNFTKRPCVTEKPNAEFKGKDNDFTITTETPLSKHIKENLSQLETITDKEAGADYHDPNNTGNPLYIIKNPEFSLAPNFKLKEFATSGGKVLPYARIDEDLVVALQTLRNDLQQPVFVSSAYRTISRNKAERGSSISRHLSGDAADIYVKGIPPQDLMKRIEILFRDNIGLHAYKDGHVHLDLRGYKARW